MPPKSLQKQMTLTNALLRVKRASMLAAPAFSRRRQEVLAAHCIQGEQIFVSMTQFLRQENSLTGDRIEQLISDESEEEKRLKESVLKFVSEPSQRVAIELLRSSAAVDSISALRSPTAPVLRGGSLEGLNVGRLAWGALSFNKANYSRTRFTVKPELGDTIRGSQSDHLNLKDLSILGCSVCYQGQQLDFSFMSQLSSDGAEIIHRTALLIAIDYGLRIDAAIIAAARILIDPLVGGDARHCYCMLKRRQLPASWTAKYNLC